MQTKQTLNFSEAIKTHQTAFELDLGDDQIAKLNDYYEFVIKNNEFLNLVAPCSAEEFAIRHILESLMALHYFPFDASFADIGPGAGLPSIPCLLVRDTLKGRLIESKAKKVKFLKQIVEKFELGDRAKVLNKQFREARKPDVSFVVCRALDKFTQNLPAILSWSKKSSVLLFAGNNMRDALNEKRVKFEEKLIPMSEQRFIFLVKR